MLVFAYGCVCVYVTWRVFAPPQHPHFDAQQHPTDAAFRVVAKPEPQPVSQPAGAYANQSDKHARNVYNLHCSHERTRARDSSDTYSHRPKTKTLSHAPTNTHILAVHLKQGALSLYAEVNVKNILCIRFPRCGVRPQMSTRPR